MKTAWIVLLLLGFAGIDAADAERFEIHPGEKENQVKFDSHAPLESFDGKTNQVSGLIECDPENLENPVSIRIEVDLASLDTGIKLRNKHMRKNHLETKKYPKAVFTADRISERSSLSLVAGEPVTFHVTGNFELHGITREVTATVEATLNLEGDLEIVSRFDVLLSDYKIKRPRFLLLKLDETQKVTIKVTARVASGAGSG